MGKVVYHWDDLRHTAFDNSTLRLAAIADVDSFSYCITEPSGRPCAVKGFTFDRKYHFFDKPLGYLNQVMGMDELLYADFNHVQIAVRGVPFIAVRPDETERGHLFARLQAVTDIQKSDVLITDSGVKDVLCAFVLPELFVRETEGWFSGTKISHLISALISEAIRLSREHDERILLVNCSGSLAEMVLCDHGNLLFANHYHIAGPEDVLYYILAILDDFHLEALHVGVECIGPAADSVHLFLQSYLPRVGLFSFHEISPRSDFPRVESADLLCVAKCAS